MVSPWSFDLSLYCGLRPTLSLVITRKWSEEESLFLSQIFFFSFRMLFYRIHFIKSSCFHPVRFTNKFWSSKRRFWTRRRSICVRGSRDWWIGTLDRGDDCKDDDDGNLSFCDDDDDDDGSVIKASKRRALNAFGWNAMIWSISSRCVLPKRRRVARILFHKKKTFFGIFLQEKKMSNIEPISRFSRF